MDQDFSTSSKTKQLGSCGSSLKEFIRSPWRANFGREKLRKCSSTKYEKTHKPTRDCLYVHRKLGVVLIGLRGRQKGCEKAESHTHVENSEKLALQSPRQ